MRKVCALGLLVAFSAVRGTFHSCIYRENTEENHAASQPLSALPLLRTGLLIWGCDDVDAADVSHSWQLPVKREN